MSVIPPRNLPPQAERWGRSVDDRLASFESVVSRNGQDNNNTLSALNATLTRLGEQVSAIAIATEQSQQAVEKLSRLRTYATEAINIFEIIAADDGSVKIFPGNTSLTVTLGPNTQLLVTVSAEITAAPRGNATSRGDLFVAGPSYQIDGSPDYYFNSLATTAHFQNTVLEDGEYVGAQSSVSLTGLTVRNPGTYTIRPGLIGYKSPSAEEGMIAATRLSIVAQVIPSDGF